MLDDGIGLGRRKAVRRMSAELAVIVAESYEPGATVAVVARRYGIVPFRQGGHDWKRVAIKRT
ncbi:hypothetical protein DS901_16645 [Loktanella sp. D2R18]|uniref:transposase n=1 Tax=Rhodobacterales TaxID=204455 RepID=UPI000DE9D573|nr:MULTISPECIES: transposase [Rhodobacterales]MDO6591761.1 transposase [Yoonia sp. 1_MG-2023]RBW42322.1 hypothetical protein DS901_16645 [Loktanella sp. D2R18]